jgi:hypothetical protein
MTDGGTNILAVHGLVETENQIFVKRKFIRELHNTS